MYACAAGWVALLVFRVLMSVPVHLDMTSRGISSFNYLIHEIDRLDFPCRLIRLYAPITSCVIHVWYTVSCGCLPQVIPDAVYII